MIVHLLGVALLFIAPGTPPLASPAAPFTAPPPAPNGAVVIVTSSASPAARDLVTGFKRRLEQRGGRITGEVQLPPAPAGGSAALAGMHIRSSDVVLVIGSEALAAVQRLDGNPNVIAALAFDRAVADGGHVTGVGLDFPIEKQLQLLRRILPDGVHRAGIVFSPAHNARQIQLIQEAGRAAGLEILTRPVTAPSEIPQALASLATTADVLWGVADDLVITPETARSILLFSLRNRVPLIGLSSAWVRAGALIALERDYADIGAQCAEQAARLLAGEPITAVRPEAPRRALYVINQRTAEQMNIRFSAETLRNAQEVLR